MTLLIEPEATSLVCFNTTDGPIVAISPKVTEGLLDYDYELTLRPELAVVWSISEGNLGYTFRLRLGVKFHDGRHSNSADVAFSIALAKEARPRGRNTFANVTTVETRDPLIAVMVLSNPAPYLLYALAAGDTPIVPRYVYAGPQVDANPNNNAPIGARPFRFPFSNGRRPLAGS